MSLLAAPELSEVLAELEYRKRHNPLDFFNPLPAQQLFLTDKSRFKNIFGGNRSGKTEAVTVYILAQAIKKPLRIWCCAETFPDSVNIQQRKIAKFLPRHAVKYGAYDEINGFTNRKLLLKNGSIIIFKSYDQGVMTFAQDDIDIIWNDEEPPYDIFREQKMRLLDRDGQMIISMTSLKGVTDLLADIFEDGEIVESRPAPLLSDEILPVRVEKDGIKFYMLWTTDNPHIVQERVLSDVKQMGRDEIKSRIYGIPVNLSGKIYPIFNRNIHVIPLESAPREKIMLYHILDPHDRKPWAMKWIALHITGTAYCVDEYPNRDFNEMITDDKTYDEYVQIIKEKENNLFDIFHQSIHKRIIDPNFGNKTMQLIERIDHHAHTSPKEELKKRGLKFQDGIDTLEAGHLKVREALHYEIKDNEIVMQPKYFLTDNCINSIKHLSRYSRKDIMAADGDVRDSVKPQEKYKDFCDLDRYFWMSNPRYVTELKEFSVKAPKIY